MKISDDIIEFDNLKTKVLKYVLYKKRTEQEVRQKFIEYSGKNLDDVIEYLKSENYINDTNYIEKCVNEFIALKNLSIQELTYKLYSKGLKKELVDEYIYSNRERMLEYEIRSIKNIIAKKSNVMEFDEIKQYLNKKGYMSETIKIATEEA